MIVGEAPGFNEDRQGEPFVGAAGKLLDTLLARISLSRADVYITNVLKCRPPMNRDPMPNEVESCSPYLKEQLALVKPKVVLILGRHALERLMVSWRTFRCTIPLRPSTTDLWSPISSTISISCAGISTSCSPLRHLLFQSLFPSRSPNSCVCCENPLELRAFGVSSRGPL